MPSDDRLRAGTEMRAKVLGEEHVKRSLANSRPFTRPVQELVTEYCWGEVWCRPGLALRDRSLINLAMLTALNRGEELKVHVRGALNNGVSVEEIQETLLQTAIYCGVPAALTAFRIAQSVVDDLEGAGRGDGADGATAPERP